MAESTPLSLAEVMAAMSIAVDIGMGRPLEQGLGVCLLAVRFGEVLGLDENERQAIFEIALLRHIGCTAETVDFASIMGDELLARASGGPFVDWASPSEALRFLAGHIVRTHTPGRALFKIARLPGAMPRLRAGAVAVCEVANLLADRFGMPDRTRADLTTVYERWDDKGFPGRLSGEAIPLRGRVVQLAETALVFVGTAALSTGERLLASADAYSTLVEPRPHRPGLSADRAADELRASARLGQLDGELVRAVLATADHAPRRRLELVAGLTPRELEVLRLLSAGLSTRSIAAQLVIAPKTADAHIQHIYTKIGVSTRAAATMFAMQHDLIASKIG